MATFNRSTPADSSNLKSRMTLAVEDVEFEFTEDGKIFLKSAVIYTGDGYGTMAGALKVQTALELPATPFVLDDDFAALCARCNVAMNFDDANEGRYCYSCNCDLAKTAA